MDIVLIHLGGRLPRFLATAAAQIELISGSAPLIVGARDGRRLDGTRLRRFRAGEGLTGMGLAGFWRFAAERFFVLEEVMRKRGIDRCLHLESDNLLYIDPARIDGWLADTYGATIALCPLTDDEDTAGVMYVGSLAALEAFNEALVALVELGSERLLAEHGGTMANEMRMIHLLRTRQGLGGALPTTIAAARELGSDVVFDAASYGQWVGGTHATPGVPYAGDHHVVGREFLTGRYELLWDAHQRIPSVHEAGDARLWPLANLHVHSKQLDTWATAPPPLPPRPPSLRVRVASQLRAQADPITAKISARRAGRRGAGRA
ncbi:hypothetical protein BH20ACT16_BH20ACT16_03240 [soil metagenome]